DEENKELRWLFFPDQPANNRQSCGGMVKNCRDDDEGNDCQRAKQPAKNDVLDGIFEKVIAEFRSKIKHIAAGQNRRGQSVCKKQNSQGRKRAKSRRVMKINIGRSQ